MSPLSSIINPATQPTTYSSCQSHHDVSKVLALMSHCNVDYVSSRSMHDNYQQTNQQTSLHTCSSTAPPKHIGGRHLTNAFQFNGCQSDLIKFNHGGSLLFPSWGLMPPPYSNWPAFCNVQTWLAFCWASPTTHMIVISPPQPHSSFFIFADCCHLSAPNPFIWSLSGPCWFTSAPFWPSLLLIVATLCYPAIIFSHFQALDDFCHKLAARTLAHLLAMLSP